MNLYAFIPDVVFIAPTAHLKPRVIEKPNRFRIHYFPKRT